MTIGFIGNPNCGKTTLFNAYTGANLKVANWPGVTVEKVEGAIKDHDLNIRLVDLPGTYSLTSYTMEEQVSRQFILSDEVDVIIDVADASALERNLYLTLQLLELGKPVVLALNMMDIVEKRGMEIDTHRLPEMLGIPVIPVSARKRTGLDVLLHAAAHHKDCKDPECLIHHHKYTPKHRHDHHSEYAMVYSDAIEDKITKKLALLDKYFIMGQDVEAKVLIRTYPFGQKIEVTIPTEYVLLRAEETSDDLYEAIDLVIDKLERQIRKYKTKLSRKSKNNKLAFNINTLEALEEPEEEDVVVKTKTINPKPMDMEEAIMQMELIGHSFFVYKDIETNTVCVVYKRRDGGYGLLETEE